MKTPCLLFTGPERVELAHTEIPRPTGTDILVETHFSAISPGTELRCLAGRQMGAPPFPFIPGYALSGVVVEVGPAATWQPGDRVFASGTRSAAHARLWGGHCGHALVDGAHAIAVPPGVSLRAAATAKLAAIAYHGLTLSAPQPHERVAVVGLGPIGRFSAELHQLAGARVVATDLSARRRADAKAGGLETVDPAPGLGPAFATVFPGGAEIVVDATGAPAVLAESALLARKLPWDHQLHPPARLVLQGSYATPPPFPYDAAFDRELRLLVPRDCRRADISAVLGLMDRGTLRPETFVDAINDLAQAPAVYAALRSAPDTRLTATFAWHTY